MLCYAVDLSFYMNEEDLERLGGENFITTLNKSNSNKNYGIVIDKDKSSIVKSKGLYRKDSIKVLVLEYKFETGMLKSNTRGRNEN